MYILDFQTDKSSFIMYFWLRQLQCHMANVGVYNNPISLGGESPSQTWNSLYFFREPKLAIYWHPPNFYNSAPY